ncbi:MAG TPA: radical SAM protein, partial [Negativicutes bacterium]
QNWQIAQSSPETVELMPEKAVAAALAQGKQNVGIAYTYSEPSVWYEYILDTAKLVRQAGLKNVLVTNGFINPEPLAELLPYLDALNIDVKAFNDTFYQKICSGRLGAVKRTVEQAAAACHVEVTTLLIPGQNDDREELAALAKWLAALNPGIPLHFSRYFPNYKMAEPPTPPATLEMAWQTAREYLEYVYLGNMGTAGNNTYCPCCGYLVIDRTTRRSWLAADKKCPRCGSIIRLTGEVCY